uniref:Calponin-homology (CH) domain-containing protein n=1 Tax=Meloidogyne hapla TaxID=6305 RepID=A0A1I8AWY9_MELHA
MRNINGSLNSPFPLPKSSPFIQRRGKMLKSSMDDGINLKSVPTHQINEKNYLNKNQQKNNNIFPIHLIQARLVYTEWANHHLLKAKLPPLTDLTGELCLPHKLIPLIYSIIVEFNNISLEQLMNKMEAKEPVTTIEKCLDFCKQIGVHSEDIKPRDIRNGHLGAILQLLHQLSEYKRQKRKIIEDKNIHQRRVHFNNLQQQSPKHLSNPSYCSHNSFSKTSSSHIYEQCSSSSGYGSVCHTNISGGSTVSVRFEAITGDNTSN